MTTSLPAPSLQSLQRVYTTLAPVYDLLAPWISDRGRTLGLRWLDVQDGEHVLEVGVGTGLAFHSLLAQNPSGWTEGVDATPAMLSRARRRAATLDHDRYALRQEQADRLPYDAHTFDAAFASYFIDVVPPRQQPAVLRELHRVLTPAGRLVLVHLSPPQRRIEEVWDTLSHFCPLVLGGAQPIDVAPLLRRTHFAPVRRTTCVQLGLRSGIVEARPQ